MVNLDDKLLKQLEKITDSFSCPVVISIAGRTGAVTVGSKSIASVDQDVRDGIYCAASFSLTSLLLRQND